MLNQASLKNKNIKQDCIASDPKLLVSDNTSQVTRQEADLVPVKTTSKK